MKVKTLLPLWISAGLFSLFALFGAASHVVGISFFYNTSASAPVGFYVSYEASELKKGDRIVLKLPESVRAFARERGWLRDAPLIKKVGGVEGDEFCVRGGEFSIGGEYQGPVLKEDREGRAMPEVSGCSTVGPGELIVVGIKSSRSFDSRYFGVVKGSEVIGKMSVVLF